MIEKVTIENFKSIGRVEVELSPTTVFIGRSGVGKSNFLRAIRFLRDYLLSGDQAAELRGGRKRIWPAGVAAPVGISICFRLPGFSELFFYGLEWTPPQARAETAVLSREVLELGVERIFERDKSQWLAWPEASEKPKPSSASVQTPVLNSFPTVPEAVLAYTALTDGIGWHDFPAVIMTGAAPAETLPNRPNGQRLDVPGLSDSGGNYRDIIKRITQDLRNQRSRRQILARVQQVNPTIRSIELDSMQDPKAVIVGHEMGGQRVALNLSQESDGLRRYYAHLLALYQTPPKQVLMFEEPENGIFPGALRNLAEEFESSPGEDRGQVLLTTQSPELLDGFEPEAIRVVDLDPQTQQTRIGPLDPRQAEAVRERLLDPGELLTVDTARIAAGEPREEPEGAAA